MTATTQSPPRIASLDIVRGAAVMGILAMNIIAFAMPMQAYFNPLAYGADSALDMASYAFSFVLIDGKMRGLFSFLFGASLLLVFEKAQASGRSGTRVTFARQFWLLVIGMIHFYLIWMGDILISYALAGSIAFLFRNKSVRALVKIATAFFAMLLLIQSAMTFGVRMMRDAAARGDQEMATQYREFVNDFGIPDPAVLQEAIALHRGPWTGIVHNQLTEHLFEPLFFFMLYGWETIGFMLLGMAALKSGFLTGAWEERRYVRWAAWGIGIGIAAYSLLAVALFASGFSVPAVLGFAMAATVPFRPLMVVGYAALIILLTDQGGWLTQRVAAAGRAAFTNYLGTSVLMTFLFYGWGLGLYGSLDRAELWLVVLGAWAIMLAWSKPWLERFAYGPLEWLWRSLARGRPQPMRGAAIPPA